MSIVRRLGSQRDAGDDGYIYDYMAVYDESESVNRVWHVLLPEYKQNSFGSGRVAIGNMLRL